MSYISPDYNPKSTQYLLKYPLTD